MLKTFNRMKKRVGFLLYQFVLPALQVSLFCLAIGREPKGMSVAVVNEEVGAGGCLSWSEGCLLDSQNLSLQEEAEDEWLDWDVSEPDLHLSQVS